MSRMGDMMREAAEECVLDGLQKVLDDAGLAVDRVMLRIRSDVDSRCGSTVRGSDITAGVEDILFEVKDRLIEAASTSSGLLWTWRISPGRYMAR